MRIENFLPKKYVEEIELLLTNPSFPWYFNSFVALHNDHQSNNFNPGEFQFTHVFNIDGKIQSNYYDSIAKPILFCLQEYTGLDIKSIVRIKANLTTRGLDKIEDQMLYLKHTDVPLVIDDIHSYKSFLYYVNQTDGDTVLLNDSGVMDKFTPIKGTGLLFNSSTWHYGLLPRFNKRKVVVNFVFKI